MSGEFNNMWISHKNDNWCWMKKLRELSQTKVGQVHEWICSCLILRMIKEDKYTAELSAGWVFRIFSQLNILHEYSADWIFWIFSRLNIQTEVSTCWVFWIFSLLYILPEYSVRRRFLIFSSLHTLLYLILFYFS